MTRNVWKEIPKGYLKAVSRKRHRTQRSKDQIMIKDIEHKDQKIK